MDKIVFLTGISLVYFYLNYEEFKIKYLKYVSTLKSKKLVINFFKKEIKNNINISLEEAILKFEDPNFYYESLDQMSKKKGRPVECYIKAYKNSFLKAKK